MTQTPALCTKQGRGICAASRNACSRGHFDASRKRQRISPRGKSELQSPGRATLAPTPPAWTLRCISVHGDKKPTMNHSSKNDGTRKRLTGPPAVLWPAFFSTPGSARRWGESPRTEDRTARTTYTTLPHDLRKKKRKAWPRKEETTRRSRGQENEKLGLPETGLVWTGRAWEGARNRILRTPEGLAVYEDL